MQLRTHRVTHWARTLILAVVVMGLLAPAFVAPAHSQARTSVLAPRLGPGNQVTMGSRESGIFFEYTLTGAECGERQRDGAVTCTLTSDTVTASGTLYNSLGEGLYTRPTAEAKLGQQWAPVAAWKQVSWPPPEMRDAEGYVSGPFEHEEAFAFSWDVKPELGVVIFNVWVGKVNGASEGVGVGAWMYPPAATDTPEAPVPTDTPVPTTTPVPPAGGKPPCDYPLFFYPDQDFSQWYTDQPSLNYTQDQLTNDLLKGFLRYTSNPQNKATDGAFEMDPREIARTFTSDSTLEIGKKFAPALQEAARALASQKRAGGDANYRVSPGDLLELSLKLAGGNVRNALITCHAATYRDKAGANNKFVQQEGVLQPLRNPMGYADRDITYTTPQGGIRHVNPRKSLGSEEQGVWYHLYGTAALEFTDRFGAASYYGAQVAIGKSGNAAWIDALDKIQTKGMPITGLGGLLGDLAVALEEAIRSRAGKPPDVDKNCLNYWGLKAGHDLKYLVQHPEKSAPASDSWTPSGKFEDRPTVAPLGHGKATAAKSPLSLRIDGTNGEWFSFDQTTKQFDGNTALVVYDFFPEDDGTFGLVAQPLFQVSSILWTATGSGPAQIATYDPATRKAEAYELSVQPGDHVYVSGQDEPAQLNGSPLTPAAVTLVRPPSPIVPVAAVAGGVLLLGVIGFAARTRRRPARAGRARPIAARGQPAPAQGSPWATPAAPARTAPGTCQACGAALKPGVKFCGNCGAAVPETQAPSACPRCGAPVNPGVRFCGTCGSAIG
jgi:hypothetical protein